jgi:membrane protein required for colicin V production
MAWVDWAIVIILAASVLGGLAQGFFRSVCSLLGLVLGLGMAAWNYARLAAAFLPLVRVRAVADTVAFVLIALLVMAICAIIGAVLAKMFRLLGLGCLDGLAGAIFGFLQGVFLVTLGILVLAAFYPDQPWLAQARLPKMFLGPAHLSTHITPSELAERIRHGLRTMETESPRWMHEERR